VHIYARRATHASAAALKPPPYHCFVQLSGPAGCCKRELGRPSACCVPAVQMLRPGDCNLGHRLPAHSAGSSAAAFKAKLDPSLSDKLCSLKNGRNLYSGPKTSVAASPATSAPINAQFLQLMRVKMIKAFINSETAANLSQDTPLPPPPSLDRVLLQRATLNSRKLHLLCGQAPVAAPDSCNPWHDPILVTHPLALRVFVSLISARRLHTLLLHRRPMRARLRLCNDDGSVCCALKVGASRCCPHYDAGTASPAACVARWGRSWSFYFR